ncbi:hypothetical protein LY76DRAFT_511677 [Colletotrichum caudatum]|nr:hypothetical protein LY76DRAFT_511677 [Colletotrichum caudatum]
MSCIQTFDPLTDVHISAVYVWDVDGNIFGTTIDDEGLFFWRRWVYNPSMQEMLAELTFNIETSCADELANWLKIDDERLPWLLSPENVAWIKSKLLRCQTECVHTKPTASFLPTTLIDVGQTDQDDRYCLEGSNPSEDVRKLRK